MAKYKPKTIATAESVIDYLATLDEPQRRDCQLLIDMMQRVSGEPPVLWGSIIGFGSYHYVTKSGGEADWPLISFAQRRGKLSLYLSCDVAELAADLEQVGKHGIGKGCIYFKNLDHVDIDILEKVVAKAYEASKELLA